MVIVLILLKALRLVDFGSYDMALGMLLADLDILILLRLIWTIRRWR